jgi:hypothetical protein
MKTKIDTLLEEFDLVIFSVQKIIGISYTQKDYAGFIKSLGGEVETLLKATVYSNQSNHASFNDLINDLSLHGITATAIQSLHDLRVVYNKFKHDPLYYDDILNTLALLKKAKLALQEIKTLSLGDVNTSTSPTIRRTVWIAAWDDYIGGMTEISIFLPNYDIDFPFAFDNFNIDIAKWDVFKEHFTGTGELRLGAEYVSEKAYEVWSANVDLIGVGAFTGDTRELNKFLSSLVNVNRENELLDFLRRPNDTSSISVSLIYALFDAFHDDSWKSLDDLRDEVRLRAAYYHAIPIGGQVFDYFLDCLNPEIEGIDRNELRGLKQILWLDSTGYAKQEILLPIINPWRMAISKDGNFVCDISIN